MRDNSSVSDNRFSGAVGEDYDATFKLICPHLDDLEQSVADGLLPLNEIKSRCKLDILDLGCGDELTPRSILNTLKNVQLTALDNEPQMLLDLQENLKEFTSCISVVEEDALSFLRRTPSGTFDGVGSCFTIHNWR